MMKRLSFRTDVSPAQRLAMVDLFDIFIAPPGDWGHVRLG
jgi:hypothetical protein